MIKPTYVGIIKMIISTSVEIIVIKPTSVEIMKGNLAKKLMNKPNNKRKKGSMENLEKAFIELLQTKEINQIGVTDICKQAGLNRTTFYASYVDIYDLADSIRNKLEEALSEFYHKETGDNENYLRLFRHMKANQVFYKTYFKLGYDNRYKILSYPEEEGMFDGKAGKDSSWKLSEEYQLEFFRGGILQMTRMWLCNGCQETPEMMAEVVEKIRDQYLESAWENKKFLEIF